MITDTQIMVFNNGIRATQIGLEIPEDLPEVKWEEIGRKLGNVETAYQWMVGDWWVFGEKHYGNRRPLVESPTWNGPAYNTCVMCGVTCRAFETHLRRCVLSFAHHKESAALMVAKPKLAREILDWCEEPLKAGKKKPRSIAEMKREIKKRLDKHFEPMKRAKATPKEFEYIEFIGPIELFAKHTDFDLKTIAKVQVDLFGEPDMLREDIEACKKVVAVINGFLKEVNNLCTLVQERD